MSIENRKHTQKRSHPFRRYIATTEDNDRDEFRTIPIGEINAGNVGNANSIIGGSGR